MNLNDLTMIPISKEDVIKDSTISWVIKYDMLQCDEIFIVEIDLDIINHYTPEIMFMRRYNKKYQPMKKFHFNLHNHQYFYTMKTKQLDFHSDDIYNTIYLEYAYDNRNKEN